MPALFIVLGIAVVVFIAAAGHPKHTAHHGAHPPGTVVVELDRGMPPSVVGQVLAALGHESDPARLDALGATLGAHYPLSAGELRARAATLRVRGGEPAALPEAAPQALPSLAPEEARQTEAPAAGLGESTWPTRTPTARDLDVATVLQAAMRALVEETDPVVLDGFAESIRAPYPAAADILADRAHALRASAAVALTPAEGPPAATAETAMSAAPSPSLSPSPQVPS
jgi:hypothetical protein